MSTKRMPTLAFRKVRACSFQIQALSFKVSMLKEDDSRYEGADSAQVRVERQADREEKSPTPAMAGKSSTLNRPAYWSALGSSFGADARLGRSGRRSGHSVRRFESRGDSVRKGLPYRRESHRAPAIRIRGLGLGSLAVGSSGLRGPFPIRCRTPFQQLTTVHCSPPCFLIPDS
jgi:hypothetical protein